MSWRPFEHDGVVYELDHLNSSVITVTREAAEQYPERQLKVFLSYGDHCFTGHHGESDEWIYPYAKGQADRYFCSDRYEYSKHLPDLVPKLIDENVYILKTFNKHREQFFHLETRYLGIDYRLFLEVSKSNRGDSDVRIKVVSAYEQEVWSNPVTGQGRFKFWSVIDARLQDKELVVKERRGRRR